MALKSLEPDAFDIDNVLTPKLAPCPFCGRLPLTHTYVNDEPMFGKGPIYRATVSCVGDDCMATVGYNSRDKEEAREKAIERWQKRV